MISIRTSRAQQHSALLSPLARKPGEDNLGWLERAQDATATKLAAFATKQTKVKPRPDKCPWLLLLGGHDAAHLRLRMAQAHARNDLTPSHWSHVVLVTDEALKSGWEIPLCPPTELGFPPETNGVRAIALQSYASRSEYPNLALLNVPVKLEDAEEAREHFQKDRATLDAVELLAVWLAYLWGVGRFGNPLLDGQGLPAAVFVEAVMNAAQFDLTPGLSSRSSCPEAIWQAAKWWANYHTDQHQPCLAGSYVTSHKLA
jgi:hypothetical protein